MKNKLLCFVLCLSFIFLFGVSGTNYKVSNIVHTAGNIDLVGKQVSVRGLTEGTFHVLSYDGEKVKLLSDLSEKSFPNFIGAGSNQYEGNHADIITTTYENSQLYHQIQENTANWKSKIEAAGGNTTIYKIDAPTLDELLAVGHFEKQDNGYVKTNQTPDWIIGHDNDSTLIELNYFTQTVKDGRVFYVDHNGIFAVSDLSLYHSSYESDLRVVLETSIYNLSSDDPDISKYIEELNKQKEENKTQIVKVPSTGMDVPIIFATVGIAIIVIAGITIWVIVSTKKNNI